MAKAERTNHNQSTATNIKTASQAHPRFVALMSAMAASAPAPIPEPVLVSYVDGPDWQVFFDALNVSGHCCTDLPNFS
jgi:hypothetical protein